jgi:hypothetical protein
MNPEPMTPEEKQRVLAVAHLIGEALPGCFTITIAVERDENGNVPDKGRCKVYSNPKDDNETKMVLRLVELIS